MARPPWYWRRRPLAISPLGGESDAAEPPCIVHLVRAANGIESLRGFIDALRANPPGVECQLVLAMKGFSSREHAAPYVAEAADLAPEVVFFPDRGMDVGLYLAAAAHLRRDRYCFVNSNIRPAVKGWLAKLDAGLRLSDVGIVGPYGSWASSHSWMTYSLGLPSYYRDVLPPVPVVREELRAIDLEQSGSERLSRAAALRYRLLLLSQLPEELLGFEPFPDRHLRTSIVMLSHAVLSELRLFVVRNKQDAYALESGSHSLTRQVERMGLRALVVDRSGAVWESHDWPRSRTYCLGEQEGLLVTDNRTRFYELGSPLRRTVLSGLAWGERTKAQLSAATP